MDNYLVEIETNDGFIIRDEVSESQLGILYSDVNWWVVLTIKKLPKTTRYKLYEKGEYRAKYRKNIRNSKISN